MNGKAGRAPCGHPGEAIVGQYYRCLKGCDKAVPDYVDPEKTPRWIELFDFDDIPTYCPSCKSDDTEPFPHNGATMHCIPCGAVW